MTEFYKVSGSGNDFVALAEPAEAPSPEMIRAWCRRGVSLGADGVFVLRRGREAVGMDYYNADGYPAELCLNGTRCAAQLAFHLGWANGVVTVRTASGAVGARRLDAARVTLELLAPETPEELAVEVDGIHHAGYRLRVGVPHFVLPWRESLERAPVAGLGRSLRYHPAFGEAGANVNFVRYPGRDRMEIRTYERGVEAETLSCGSGILASVRVGVHLGRIELPVRVSVQGGFELEVGESGSSWLLTGDARVVARGDLLEGAEAAPPAPPWS
ncbi:MAG: diaminopimelate epimerase [Acidobacteriota bacterium]